MSAPVVFDAVAALRMVVRIRLVELVLTRAWKDGVVPGELHSGIGEEGVYAGVLSHLGRDDAVSADHRSTGPLVARGADLTGLMVEVMGGEAGMNAGQAGHMHLMDPALRVAADGIVGSSAPLAVGQALAAQRLRPGAVAVAFFGEGALNAGVVLEAMNLATVWALPVLFVCKDNRWSITTRTASVTAGDPRARVAALGMPVTPVDGERVDQVHARAGALLHRARQGNGPAMLYASCHRPGGHLEGDPLLRIMRDPWSQLAELGPGILGGLSAPSGSTARERAAGVLTVAGRVAGAVGHWGIGHGHDPVRHARRLVDERVADHVRDEEQRLVATAAAAAVASLDESSPSVGVSP